MQYYQIPRLINTKNNSGSQSRIKCWTPGLTKSNNMDKNVDIIVKSIVDINC